MHNIVMVTQCVEKGRVCAMITHDSFAHESLLAFSESELLSLR